MSAVDDPRFAYLDEFRDRDISTGELLDGINAADREVGVVRAQLSDLPDPDKLHLLADWFDMDDVLKERPGGVEVQADLRRWARALAAIRESQ